MVVLLPVLLMWARSPMYFPDCFRWTLVSLFCCVVLVTPGRAADKNASPTENAYEAAAEQEASAAISGERELRREGDQLRSVSGRFVEVGRRWLFIVDADSSSFRVLENLGLQRVTNAVRQDAEDNRWTVHGTLTEFNNENYLLIQSVTRAPGRTLGE